MVHSLACTGVLQDPERKVVVEKDPPSMLSLLDHSQHVVDFNAQDNEGNTPLHLATRSDLYQFYAHSVEVLLRRGADPNIPNAAGKLSFNTDCFLARIS